MTTLRWPRPSAAMGRRPKPQGFQGMPATLQCCQLGRKVGESSDSPTVPTLRHYRSGYPSARVGLLAVRPSLIFPSYTSGGAQEGAAALTRGSIAAV